jgi:cytochrome c oxidase subunit 1
VLPFVWNVFRSYRFGRVVTVDDPWGFGNSLEWATSCPPPRHNFTELPRIRSERPAFELHYPHMVERFRQEAHVGGKPSPYEVVAQATARETQPNDDPKSR